MRYLRGEYEAALPHARRAFQLLPAGDYRMLYVSCLRELERLDEAWAVMAQVWPESGPNFALVAAQLADRVRPSQAPAVWRRCVEQSPDDPQIRLSLARALFHGRQRDAAADEAWRAFESVHERMQPWMFHLAGRLQLSDLDPPPRRVERARAILDQLRTSFPGNPEAESIRAELQTIIGEAIDVDFPLLVATGLALQTPVSMLAPLFEASTKLELRHWELYADAEISLSALARVLDTPQAKLFRPVFLDTRRRRIDGATRQALGRATSTLAPRPLLCPCHHLGSGGSVEPGPSGLLHGRIFVWLPIDCQRACAA